MTNLPKRKISEPAIWDNESFSVSERARAYLDSNCAHCHRKGGSAGNSGFYLSLEQNKLFLTLSQIAKAHIPLNLSKQLSPHSE